MAMGVLLQGLLISGHIPFLHIGLFRGHPATAMRYQTVVAARDQSTTLTVRMHRPNFQTGMIFPQWGINAYDSTDANWQIGLKDIQQQTAAQWIELPINFYQSPADPTQILTTDNNTPTPAAVAAGIRSAHAKHYHVFVVPLLTVTPGRYKVPWSGSIDFKTVQETEAWFTNYWNAFQPYVSIAAQTGAEQLAI